jgi:hypothetical protein
VPPASWRRCCLYAQQPALAFLGEMLWGLGLAMASPPAPARQPTTRRVPFSHQPGVLHRLLRLPRRATADRLRRAALHRAIHDPRRRGRFARHHIPLLSPATCPAQSRARQHPPDERRCTRSWREPRHGSGAGPSGAVVPIFFLPDATCIGAETTFKRCSSRTPGAVANVRLLSPSALCPRPVAGR